MSSHEENESSVKSEPLVHKGEEELHGEDSSCSSLSSSSDSENERAEKVEKKAAEPEKVEKVERSLSPEKPPPKSPSGAKSAIYRIFGRQKSVHEVFGGGKPADVFLWRNKKISVGVLGVATAVWVFFELLEYHLLTLVCHSLILALALLFLWSNVTTFIKKSPPHIPDVSLPREPVVEVISALRNEINCAISVLRNVASGRDLKTFLLVIASLWILSIVGSWCNFITLFYIVFVLLHTVPVLYEKYEDQADSSAEKAIHEIKKQYAVFDAKVVSKIPLGPLKNKML